MSTQWIAAVSIVVIGLTLLIGLAACQARFSMHPESARKSMHIGTGLLALFFPWLFNDFAPVLAIAVSAMLILLVARKVKLLRRHLATVFDEVGRSSRGDVYFVVAIVALFGLSDGDKMAFVVSVLVLTFADAAAALVGVRYGGCRLPMVAGDKTVAGSMAFFVVAFLCATVPILLLSHTGYSAAFAGATVLAGATTAAEAIADNGLDNLTVPFAAYGIMQFLL